MPRLLPRNRLFWRLFLLFWLAQVLASVATAFAFGFFDHFRGGPPPDWQDHRPASFQAPPEGMPPAGPTLRGPGDGHPPGPPGGLPRAQGLAMVPVMPIVFGGLVSLVFAAWLAFQFSRPIRRLQEGFARLSAGDMAARVRVDDGWLRDELDALAQDFNRMAEHLEQDMVAHKRLLHDVSHEVRSPLARMQAAADLMTQQPERGDEFVDRVLRETRRMDSLVGEILRLARLDSGMSSPQRARQALDLQQLAQEALDSLAYAADVVPCVLVNQVPPQCWVSGDPETLSRVLENVMDNAIKHTPAQGKVELHCTREGPDWVLRCDDEGPGVFEADLQRIFEPFFRSSSAGGTPGHGLGLAIARSAIENHGGSIQAVNRPRGGLSVRIRLPAIDAPAGA